ncbi:MAG: T9SS type A sorting domain-containing protein, partial [Ignavibacteriaceae bacterium]|nr:T9SS type A sorting domain-containing protein [Ignavibacteriaceae bacterium]
ENISDQVSLSKFELYQNYPNPFNPSTIIKYSIPELKFITIKVFDVLGNEIAELVNEVKPAGEYEVEFNAKALTSGIYFYQLKVGNHLETKKMLYLK